MAVHNRNIRLYFVPHRARWVKIQGMEYREQCAVVIGVEDEYPVFARVEAVYIVDGNRSSFLASVCFAHLTVLPALSCVHHTKDSHT